MYDCGTSQLPPFLFLKMHFYFQFFFIFCFLYGELRGWRVDMEGWGDGWAWGARYEIHKESIKSKIKQNICGVAGEGKYY